MPRIQDDALRVLDAMVEAKVGTVINLYELGLLTRTGTLHDDVLGVLIQLGMNKKEADEWLRLFNVR